MNLIKVSDLFEVNSGLNLELNSLVIDKQNGINFVSRTSKSNGVSAKVRVLPDVTPIPAGTISVAASGSVMETFLQIEPYYSGYHLFYLVPKISLSNEEKLYYCTCLRSNKFRYSYGRQANSTLKDLLIPSPEEIPDWVNRLSIKTYGKQLLNNSELEKSVHTNTNNNLVPLEKLFKVVNGMSSSKIQRFDKKEDESYIAFIRPSYRQDTCLSGYIRRLGIDLKYIFPKETLYVSTNGQGSHTYSYVSTFEFVPNSDVSVLIPKRKMTLQEKLYYSKCITDNRFKFSYGRKPKGKRLKSTMLPEYPPKEIMDADISNIMTNFEPILNSL
jgi:hypothetical protein